MSLVIVIVSLDGGHDALLIVHTNVLAPGVSPVTPDAGLFGVVTEAPPAITLHIPVPTAGVFPARVAVATAHTPWSVPALAVVGDASRVIVTVSLDDVHPGLPIVQTNVFAPTERPVTPEVGLPAVVTDAVPAITVQAPVPTVGVFPASDEVGEQTVWSGPAFAVVGEEPLVIVTVSLDGGQEALLIVHTNVFAPMLKPVTPDVGLPGVVTDAPPAITVHTPVPTVGVLLARAAVAEHTPKSAPAFAVVGEASLIIVTVSTDDGQDPLLIVQTNVFAPTESPVTPDDGSAGVVTVADPAITDQSPVPVVGVLPANVVVVEQTVSSVPAFAVVGD